MNKELAIKLLRGSVLGTNEQQHEAVFMAIRALKAEPKHGRWETTRPDEIYEKLQAELSQLLNTEKYKRMNRTDKEVYRQAVLACKSVVSHYATRMDEVEE